MSRKEKLYISFINFSRNRFRNTWVHRIPITSKIYRRVFSATYHGVDKNITFRGSTYKVPTTDTAVVPSMMSGDYENTELDMFNKLLKTNNVVLDIGANVGVYSIEASKKIGKKGKVFAFEPVPENVELLKFNLAANNASNVAVIPAGVGSKDGKLKLYLAEHSIATHSAGKISDKFIEVATFAIDSFVKSQKLKKIDMIKIDIEGYEGYAIEGAMKTIIKQQPILFIEFSADHLKRCGYSPTQQAKTLLQLYKYCYHIDEHKKVLRKLKSVRDIIKLRNDNLVLSPSAISL